MTYVRSNPAPVSKKMSVTSKRGSHVQLFKGMKGFTLMELMIALAIVGIIAAVGYPAYTSQIERNTRLAAQGEMMDLAASMEAYRAQNLSYGGADLTILSPTILANQAYDAIFVDPGTGNVVNVMPAGAQSWIIRITPKAGGRMAGKGALQLDNRGRTCWDKTNDASCDLTDPSLSWSQQK